MFMNITKYHIIASIFDRLKKIFRPVRYPVIYNANGADEKEKSKRALLIYIVRPFLRDDDDPVFFSHQHWRQCKQITSILGEYGFIVDVVDIGDKIFRVSRNYDLVICNRVEDIPLGKNVSRIYLATTLHHKIHNGNLRRRHRRVADRRGRELRLRRIYPEDMPYVAKSDAIVGFGNSFILSSWREAFNVPVYPFNNYGFRETGFFADSKDFSSARKNFLYFASGSQLQKGLDLLLEIFPKCADLHLYICSAFKNEEDFCICYHKELYETPNVHPVGWVTVNSPLYYETVNRCAYVVLPSCSEGQAGSVVQCMSSGLIPLVTRESGIDTEDCGITFVDDSIEEIERTIIEVSRLPETWHKERSLRTCKISEEKYSVNAFKNRWKEILSEVLMIGERNG